MGVGVAGWEVGVAGWGGRGWICSNTSDPGGERSCQSLQWATELGPKPGLLTPRPQLSCHGKLRCCSNEGLDKTGVYKTLGFPLLLLEVPIKCSLQQGHIRTKNIHLRPGGQ